jgi:hypothetical protein
VILARGRIGAARRASLQASTFSDPAALMLLTLARRLAHTACPAATSALGAVLAATVSLAVVPQEAQAEPRPHQLHDPAPVSSLTAAPAERHCTVRPGRSGCVSFEPPARGVVVAVLYAEPFYAGARVVVHLEGDVSGCTPRTYDDEGGGDLGGPLATILAGVGSVDTFHRCDVRLHQGFLGTDGPDSGWLHREARVPDGAETSSFTIS